MKLNYIDEMGNLYWLKQDLTSEEIKDACQGILGLSLHPAAVRHLQDKAVDGAIAFPRLENHVDYLFGAFYVPSNTANPSADFDSVTFVATHDAVVATVGVHPTSIRDWNQDRDLLFEINSTDSTPDGGQFILNLLRLVVTDLLKDAQAIDAFLKSQLEGLIGNFDLTRALEKSAVHTQLTSGERRLALTQINELIPAASGITTELPTMRRVAAETTEILIGLVRNDAAMDLRVDFTGRERELFSRFLEIDLVDCLLDARQLVATLDQIDASLKGIFDRFRRLSEEENVAAGRFTGAIASIMLLPTFIVGLYGQNFAKIPEVNWEYGYLFSWGAIAVLTVFQIWFFRRRRWI